MKLDFLPFKNAVAAQYEKMSKHTLFRAKLDDKEELWSTYLGSFPEGTDPIHRERSQHDCSCCRHFIRDVGDAVAIIDNKIVTIWDVEVPEEPQYEVVAKALSRLVRRNCEIENIFLHGELVAGADRTFEEIVENGNTSRHAWRHFFVNIGRKGHESRSEIPSVLGKTRTNFEVSLRTLRETNLDDVDTVLDLMSQDSLYRGKEYQSTLETFRKIKVDFDALHGEPKDEEIFVWQVVTTNGTRHSARLHGTVLGTLLSDLREGKDLEDAVGAWEFKTAPANYKRPTALVSKKMIQNAKEKLAELGLISALDRRFARMSDLNINNLLFVNRENRKIINNDVFDDLSKTTPTRAKEMSSVEEVGIEKFIRDILPRINSIEVLLENRHAGNLVSLVGPSDPTAGQLFSWPNPFSWSYAGEFADSIKERVKKAGGNVTGDFCCRLSWSNYDDLDFHMVERNCNHEIYFGNRARTSPNGGKLDVDMNVTPTTRDPVENIFYEKLADMRDGEYDLVVHQYTARETTNVGFEVEVDILGDVFSFAYDKRLSQGQRIHVATFTKKKGEIIINDALQQGKGRTRMLWNMPTQTFHRVNALMLSPNFWNGVEKGNKHYFFMLEGAKAEGRIRGFFNEFLSSELNEHRKVFEMVGAKVNIEDSDSQLSGLGFSSTQRNTLVCRVKGGFTRNLKIAF